MSITIKNLESALAGESQAHIKYRYFARIARAEGFEEVAKQLMVKHMSSLQCTQGLKNRRLAKDLLLLPKSLLSKLRKARNMLKNLRLS